MKVLTIYFDDTADLSGFEPGDAVEVTKSGGTPVPGKVLTDPFRLADLPLPKHTHPAITTIDENP